MRYGILDLESRDGQSADICFPQSKSILQNCKIKAFLISICAKMVSKMGGKPPNFSGGNTSKQSEAPLPQSQFGVQELTEDEQIAMRHGDMTIICSPKQYADNTTIVQGTTENNEVTRARWLVKYEGGNSLPNHASEDCKDIQPAITMFCTRR
uniref:Uncharacterized protein n=2 Tax=Oryza punctata TaxID=4537 RepID=A0A0E0JLQ3_ORYPU